MDSMLVFVVSVIAAVIAGEVIRPFARLLKLVDKI